MTETFYDHGIDIRGRSSGQVKTLCPRCSESRRNKKDLCLSVDIGQGVWNCHHCQWSGGLKNKTEKYYSKPMQKNYKPVKDSVKENLKPLTDEQISWFVARGISSAVVERSGVRYASVWMPQTNHKETALAFAYRENGEVVNVKYRDLNKNFKMEPDSKITLYGLDDIEGDTLIWTEGEIDKLSVDQSGLKSCVSVPNGAADKLGFLDSCEKNIDGIKTHVLAVDNDQAGKKLEAELSRRLGVEKCKRVEWPSDCKDANDVLVKHGAETLSGCIQSAKYFPVEGIFSTLDIFEDLTRLYNRGQQGGALLSWQSVRELYSVKPGEMTIVTGIPGHGKSELIDAIMIDLALNQGWKFGICSPENQPLEQHAAKLLEKKIGKPFRDGPTQRMTEGEMFEGSKWLYEHFNFVLPPEEEMTVQGILSLAKILVYRKGINGFVIDPWNELDHSRPSSLSETEYISKTLSQIRRFARTHGLHIWLIAHPTKLQKTGSGNYPVPSPYDISGSAHWRNKADNCLTVWRDMSNPDNREVQLHVQKIRFKENGKIGQARLIYDYATGRYKDSPV